MERVRGNRWVSVTAMLLLVAGCNSFRFKEPEPPPAFMPPTPGLPKRSLRVSQFVFYHDFDLKPNLPLFAELEQLRDRVHKELKLPASNTVVQVYLFEDKDRYERYMKAKYPGLPERRAFFVAQPRSVGGGEDLLVFTWWGERVQQDLRHELTHALLHSVLKDVPLWLDEGLAEYYEVGPNARGVNTQHLDDLRRTELTPSLARLEGLNQVQQMGSPDYREAWAWVHFMLQGAPAARPVLLDYIQQLRTNAKPGPLAPRLAEACPDADQLLTDHVQRLISQAPGQPTAQGAR